MVSQQILDKLGKNAGNNNREDRKALIHQTKSAWMQTLTSMDHEDDDPGTTWNVDARERDSDRMSPRMAWRAIQSALPREAIISSDIGITSILFLLQRLVLAIRPLDYIETYIVIYILTTFYYTIFIEKS